MSDLELVILLNGNFVPLRLTPAEQKIINNESINNLVQQCKDEYLYIKGATIKTDSIVGWYFRRPIEMPADKIIKFMEKKMPNDGSEDWKTQD